MIDFSVNSSDAAVFVFDKSSFALRYNKDCLDNIRNRFSGNVIFAASRSDQTADKNAEFKETCLRELEISENESDRVVCVGSYIEKAENEEWIENLHKSIERYALNDFNPLERNKDFIYDEFGNIMDKINEAIGAINAYEPIDTVNSGLTQELLTKFDDICKKRRKSFEKKLRSAYNEARKESIKKLENEFTSHNLSLSGLKKKIFGSTVKDIVKQEKLVQKALMEGYMNGEVLLADKYLGNAICQYMLDCEATTYSSCLLAEVLKDEITDNNLFAVDKDKNDKIEALINDTRNLLAVHNDDGNMKPLECENTVDLLGTIAVLGTYYYCARTYYTIAKGVPLNVYEPAQFENAPADYKIGQDIIGGMKETTKFAIGAAGVLGVDVAADGAVNLIPAVAEALGMSVPVAGAIIAAIAGAGAVKAIITDINKIQREDFFSCKNAVFNAYDSLLANELECYDDYMMQIRDRIEDNLNKLYGVGKKSVDIINAHIEADNALYNIKML